MSNRKIINAAATGGIGYYPVGNPTDAYYDNVSLLLNGDVEVDSNFANVSLLLDGNVIADKSNNKAAITNTGSVTVSSTVKKFGTGSISFSGSNYLSVPANSAFNFGTGDYTVEGWVYSTTTTWTLYDTGGSGSNDQFVCDAGALYWEYGNTSGVYSYFLDTDKNRWVHVAASRSSGTTRIFKDGVLIRSVASSNSIGNSSNAANIGRRSDGYYYTNGYIDDLRITKGLARYTSNFTPPVKAFPTHEILDSSVYRLPVTAYGNARIDTTTKKFGTGAMYFSGTRPSRLKSDAQASLAFGTSDFTIEMWVYQVSKASSYPRLINFNADYTTNTHALMMNTQDALNLFRYAVPGNMGDAIMKSTTTLSSNTWYHVAVTRSGTTFRLFVNGVQEATYTSSATVDSNATSYITLGDTPTMTADEAFNGYIDDIRITKGYARYTTNFTPPTASLPTVPPTIPADPWWGNVSLLLDGNTTDAYDPYWQNVSLMLTGDDFIDWSNQHNALTNNGTVTLDTTNKKFNASSLAFSGSNYLTVPYSKTLFDWWVSDFTLECWVNPTILSSFQQTSNISAVLSTLIGNATATSGVNYWSFGPLSNGTVRFYYYNGSGPTVTSTATISATQWSHIAMTKNSSGIQIWVNGVGNGYTAISGTPQSSASYPLTIGEFQSVGANGYIADLRITKGIARYTSNFTVPTAALPSFKIQDRTQNNLTVTPYGNVQLSTDVMKNGSGSMFFDGTGDYLKTSTLASQLQFVTGDYTIECWVYHTKSATDYETYFCGGSNGFDIRRTSTGKFEVVQPGVAIVKTSTASVSSNQWVHLCAVRISGTTYLYINGVLDSSVADTKNYTGTSYFAIGVTAQDLASYPLFGYIDDLRITKDYARYTQNFTPPSQSFATQYISTGYDANYADVSLLLNGNGTNGSQVFTDLSGTPKTITAYGNAQISTAVKKYGTGAMAFDGSGDHLRMPWNVMPTGTQDFTIEFWKYEAVSRGSGGILGYRADSPDNWQVYTGWPSSGEWLLLNDSTLQVGVTRTIPTGVWEHFAWTRSGSTFRYFINGVLQTTVTSSVDVTKSYTTCYLADKAFSGGGDFNGYIDDLRITKGIARYTTNFTPPTYQLPTDTTGTVIDPLRSSTSLLLRGNGTNGSTSFTDESPNGLTVTNNGSVTVNTTTKKYGTGAIYVPTSTSYLTVANTGSSLDLGTGDFTIEFWLYVTAFVDYVQHVSTRTSNSTTMWGIDSRANGTIYMHSSDFVVTSSAGKTANTWNHVCVVRQSSVCKMYINGVLEGTSTNSSLSSANFAAPSGVGVGAGPAGMQGGTAYIDDLRITKGIARYTANFTPPTYEDPIVTGTVYDYNYPQVSLLLNGDGTNGSTVFTDLSSSPKTITNTGSVAVNTSVKKFGTGSMYFNGTSSYLSIPYSAGSGLDFGGNDFTIELWMNTPFTPSTIPFGSWSSSKNSYIMSINGSGNIDIGWSSNGSTQNVMTATKPSANVWHHYAICRYGSMLTLYIDGVSAVSMAISGSLYSNDILYIGLLGETMTRWFPGYIDDLRITKGLARYTQNFTPPTAPLPTSYS